MSGEGVLADRPSMPGDCCGEMLADVLAYFQRRRDNAALMAARSPENADWAHDRRRQLEIIADELRAGLHVGCAAVMAQLETSTFNMEAGHGGEG